MKNKILKSLLFCFALSIMGSIANAEIKLPKIFTDNMVLQQKTDAPIWGKATPEKEVKITTSWNNQTYKVLAGKDGKWMVKVNTPKAGGPYSIVISDGKALTLNNILIGEVWICSGQSNMEMPLAGWGKVDNYEQEIAAAKYPNIRLFTVIRETSISPLEDVKSNGWQECSPETVAEFSSVAYFFGRNLLENLHIPIGLINTSWGGTIAEAWTSGNSLNYMPDFKEAAQKIRESGSDPVAKTKEEWQQSILDADPGMKKNIPVWAAPKFDDSKWPEMTVPGFWEVNGLPDFDGVVWFRKTVEIPAEWSDKNLELKLSKIDDWDITYFNGIKVGETNAFDTERVYEIPANLVKAGKATICVRVTDRIGDGGLYGDAKSMILSAKNGGKSIALSGKWKYKSTADFSKIGREPKPVSPANNPNRPTVLFNAMINPLVPFAFQGAIWYQGESNASRAAQYKELFPLMIRDWRKAWNRDFPFYFVQLANFKDVKPEPAPSDWAELREAQLQTLHLDNTGMAVIIDIGDAKDIHPKNKQDVGLRLAFNARAKTYNEKIPYSGPVYETYKIVGDKIHIQFSRADGLKSNGGTEVKGFAIAGSDHVFHWANAVIEGNKVIVSSPEVKFPVAVRYAWADNPVCNLYDGAGLPASPFRTDRW